MAAESFCSRTAAFVAKRLQRGTVALAVSCPCCLLVFMLVLPALGRGIVSCLRTVRSVHTSPTDWTLGVKHTWTWCGLPCVSAPLSSCRYRNVTVMSFSTRRPSEPAEPAAAQAASGTLPSEAHADGRRHPGRLRLGLHRLNRAVCV